MVLIPANDEGSGDRHPNYCLTPLVAVLGKEVKTPNFRVNPKKLVSRFQNIFNPSAFNTLTPTPASQNPQKLDTHL